MPMEKSSLSKAVDEVQASFNSFFKRGGFRKRGRSYNRSTSDGLTQVVHFQMGWFDPPGTTYVPRLTKNLYGLFRVELGLYVPEVARLRGQPSGDWVSVHCTTLRLVGDPAQPELDTWWTIVPVSQAVASAKEYLDQIGEPFLKGYASRDDVLMRLAALGNRSELDSTPRITRAMIHLERRQFDATRSLLEAQEADARLEGMIGHADYVADLIKQLGL